MHIVFFFREQPMCQCRVIKRYIGVRWRSQHCSVYEDKWFWC